MCSCAPLPAHLQGRSASRASCVCALPLPRSPPLIPRDLSTIDFCQFPGDKQATAPTEIPPERANLRHDRCNVSDLNHDPFSANCKPRLDLRTWWDRERAGIRRRYVSALKRRPAERAESAPRPSYLVSCPKPAKARHWTNLVRRFHERANQPYVLIPFTEGAFTRLAHTVIGPACALIPTFPAGNTAWKAACGEVAGIGGAQRNPLIFKAVRGGGPAFAYCLTDTPGTNARSQ